MFLPGDITAWGHDCYLSYHCGSLPAYGINYLTSIIAVEEFIKGHLATNGWALIFPRHCSRLENRLFITDSPKMPEVAASEAEPSAFVDIAQSHSFAIHMAK
jgi:hypothetical protein